LCVRWCFPFALAFAKISFPFGAIALALGDIFPFAFLSFPFAFPLGAALALPLSRWAAVARQQQTNEQGRNKAHEAHPSWASRGNLTPGG
jgi:hypothetical protein